MNWGKSIAVVLVVFIGFILTLVFIMISKDVDLVDEEYYQRDLAYNEEMIAIRNSNNLENNIQLIEDDNIISFKVPENEKIRDVLIIFKKPNNDADDFEIELGEKNQYGVMKKDLKKGYYNIEIGFRIGDKSFLQREQVYI